MCKHTNYNAYRATMEAANKRRPRKYEVRRYVESWHYHRKCDRYTTEEGEPITAMTTRFSSGFFNKPMRRDDGVPYYQQCAHTVYYSGGRFWIVGSTWEGRGKKRHFLTPLTGIARDVHPMQCMDEGTPEGCCIECIDGYPTCAYTEECGTFWTNGQPVEYLADWMDIREAA